MKNARGFIVLLVCGAVAGTAHAQPPDGVVVDGGMVFGLPAALPTGLSLGVGAGVSRGDTVAWGARVSWSSATEYALDWTVNHQDLRLRATTALQHTAGRGTLALRLGAGGTLVHETRTRDGGARAGLTGDELETSTWAMLPAADLEALVVLRIAGSWSVALSGGPSVDVLDGALHAGWIGGVGVAWHD